MRQRVSAFAPGNISCLFKIHEHKDPRWMGSTGVGFTLDKGVEVTVFASDEMLILLNDEPVDLPPIHYVLQELKVPAVTVSISTSLPLGAGFGLSGAIALATAYALNKLFEFGKSKKELAVVAHMADVVSHTGLGDVANQYSGGFNIKYSPSSHFILEKLPITNVSIYCRYFSKLPTTSVIQSKEAKETINMAGNAALEKMQQLQKEKAITLQNVIKVSKEFAVASGLLRDKHVQQTIGVIEEKGGYASMIMLGNAVFSDISFEKAMKLKISDTAAYLL